MDHDTMCRHQLGDADEELGDGMDAPQHGCSNLVEDIKGWKASPRLDLQEHDPYPGVGITFSSISVEVGKGKKAKSILSEISGFVEPKSLTALMGPSGSGKTTLVDVLTRRKNTGKLTGKVLYDGKKPQESFLKHNAAYVQQEDALISNLTVYETLMYNYDFLMGKMHRHRLSRKTAIHTVLDHLSLMDCKDTLVGSPFQRGISGGQRKRVSIGIHLLGRPSVLFMDEPTSGLDSYTAFEVMRLVHGLCQRGLTTITSIHAPNSSIFALFHRLLILLEGRVVYFGLGRSAVDFFVTRGFDGPLCESTSAADWLTMLTVRSSRLKRSDELAMYYSNSRLKVENDENIKEYNAVKSQLSVKKLNHSSCRESWLVKSGLWSTYCMIRHRMKANYRMPNFLIPRVFDKLVFAIVILTLYWDIGKPIDNPTVEQDLARTMQITTSLFMWGVMPVFGSIAVIPSIFYERDLYQREKKAGYYNSGSYLFAKVFEESLIIMFSSALSACPVWFALSLSGNWALFWLVYYITNIVGIVMAYLYAATAPNTEYAIIMCAGVNMILLYFVGLLIRWEDIPVYWKWVVYINHQHYAWGALMKNQFNSSDGVGAFGISVLEYFNLDDSSSSWDFLGYEVIFILVYFALGCLALRLVQYGKR
jgi:ABC-type multidrug transport system ATPase subunit